ncbi:O-acyltransferase like protein-like isoform X2 [Eurosta solidaginis]
MNRKIITDIASFATDFRIVNLWHNSTWQVDPHYPFYEPRVNIGLCLPSACTLTEVAQLMAIYVEDDLFLANDVYDLRLRVESVKDLKMRPGFFRRPSTIIFFTTCFLTLLLTFLALGRRMKRISENVDRTESEEKTVEQSKKKIEVKSHLRASGFIDCFDIQNNWEMLFPATEEDKAGGNAAFPAVNGLRFYGAMGVVLFHLLCFTYLASSNKAEHFKSTSNIGNFDIFVDLFFTISGFLQTYHFFHNIKTIEAIRRSSFTQNTKMVILYVTHRIIRLVPLYLIVMCVADAGSLMVDDLSVFHFSHRLYENCELHWWRNLLFIQNLFNHNELCMLWSWSLACDMQFYVFSIVLLFIFVKHPRAAKALTFSILTANVAYTFYIGLSMNFLYSFESTTTLFTELYMNPLSRVMAYVIGGVSGWFFVQNQQQQLYANFFQNQSLQEYLGYLSIIFFFTCSFASIDTGYTVLFYVVLLLVQRIVFAASVCGLIFANAAGCVKWFFYVLENPIFKKLNQLTYTIFLMNPLPIMLVTGLSNASIYWSPWKMIVDFIGYCATLYFFCTIFALFFEVPYKNISRLILQRTKAKTS